MLKKKYILRKNTAFTATFRLKNCKSSDFLTIYKGRQKSDESVPTKAGFVVSKKIHKRAVKRNKIKRRLRAIYLEYLKSEYAKNFNDVISVVFIARAKVLDMNYSELRESVFGLMQKF